MNKTICMSLPTFWIYKSLWEPNSCWVNGYVYFRLPFCLPKRLYQFIHLPEFYENICYFTHMPTQHAVQLFDLDSSVRWKWHLRLVLIRICFMMSKVGYLIYGWKSHFVISFSANSVLPALHHHTFKNRHKNLNT